MLDGDATGNVTAADRLLPREMLALIAGGSGRLRCLAATADTAPRRALGDVRLVAPTPRDIFCVGKNDREHAKEFASSGFDATAKDVVPEAPVMFPKPPSSVIGPGEAIPAFLDPTGLVDDEGELAIVIGTGGRGIAPADAMRHMFG